MALLGLGAICCEAACTGDTGPGGILGLDRCDEFEAKGILSRSHQTALNVIVITGTVGAALWEGSESAYGRLAWRAVDSMATTAIATESMKRVFQRPRPSQAGDPDLWRQGGWARSFPSGETAMMAAFVTPLIVDLASESPWVWSLALLPVYMGRARMASEGHWLSDVLAGAGVGVAGGWLATRRTTPLVLACSQHSAYVGWRHDL